VHIPKSELQLPQDPSLSVWYELEIKNFKLVIDISERVGKAFDNKTELDLQQKKMICPASISMGYPG